MHLVGARVKEIAFIREHAISPSSGMVEDKHAVGAPSGVALRCVSKALNDAGQRVKTPLAAPVTKPSPPYG
jgi:hypothetical protein